MQDNIVYVLNTCDYTFTEFFQEMFPGSEIIDGYIIRLSNGKLFEAYRQEIRGINIDSSIEFYKLSEVDSI